MLGKTHFMGGVLTGIYLCELHGITLSPLVGGLLGGIAALIPDIDEPHSLISNQNLGELSKLSNVKVGNKRPLKFMGLARYLSWFKPLKPVSNVVNKTVGHRSYTHTIWFCGIVGLIGSLLTQITGTTSLTLWEIIAGGALSHLILDGITKAGVFPLLPLKFRIKGPFTTGKALDIIGPYLLLGLSIYVLIHGHANILPGKIKI